MYIREKRSILNFGEYLYNIRTTKEPKKLSQQTLAGAIGVTRQHIDAIEKGKKGTPPPSLSQCLALAEVLELKGKNKEKLLWLAFKGRIKDNIHFYQYFHPEDLGTQIKKKESIAPVTEGDIEYSCIYFFELKTKNNKALISPEIKSTLDRVILNNIEEQKFKLVEIDIRDNSVSFTISTNPSFVIEEFVLGIKDLTSRNIKNLHSELYLATPSFWERGYTVYTLSNEAISKKEPVETEKVYVIKKTVAMSKMRSCAGKG